MIVTIVVTIIVTIMLTTILMINVTIILTMIIETITVGIIVTIIVTLIVTLIVTILLVKKIEKLQYLQGRIGPPGNWEIPDGPLIKELLRAVFHFLFFSSWISSNFFVIASFTKKHLMY